MAWHQLTDAQWERIEPHLPRKTRSPKGGRPRVDDRRCFEGILWILWTGAPWSALPPEYGARSTCFRRLQEWGADGTLLNLWRAFLKQLNDRQRVRWDECFVDGSFAPAKRGAQKWGKQSVERGPSGWSWPMAVVLRSEFTWTRHPRRRSGFSNPHFTAYPSRRKGDPGGTRSG